MGGGSLGCDNGISLRRPGTAEQLAWGPVGGMRGEDPPGSARTTRRRAHHLTEGETKAQTPRHSSNPNTGFLGNRVPESPFSSPQVPMLPWVPNTWSYVGSNGALWACFPNWSETPLLPAGAPPLSSSCPGPCDPPFETRKDVSAEEFHSPSAKMAQPRDVRCTKDPFLSTPYF